MTYLQTRRVIDYEPLEAVQLMEPEKFVRAAVRWFSRYLDEGKGVSLLKAHLALEGVSRTADSRKAGRLVLCPSRPL